MLRWLWKSQKACSGEAKRLFLGRSGSESGVCVRTMPEKREALGKGLETHWDLVTMSYQFGASTAIYCVPLGLEFIVVASQERSWFSLTFYSLGSLEV